MQIKFLLLSLVFTVTNIRAGVTPINVTITDVFPSNPEVSTPVAVRISLSETDATGQVIINSGSDSCVFDLPIDSCVFFPSAIGAQTITTEYSGDGVFDSAVSSSENITVLEATFPQVVSYTDGTAPGWHYFGNAGSNIEDISGDGRFVVFRSHATNLVAGDTNGVSDAYLFDHDTGILELVSLADDESLLNGSTSNARVSDDGRFVAFGSSATNATSNPDLNSASAYIC